jgi:hypothetical protein
MTDKEAMKNAIQAKICGLMDRVMDSVLNTDPFIAASRYF